MSKESQKHSSEKAYRLKTPQEHQKFYDDWADTYESQFVESKGYIYPKKIAEYFVNHVGLNHNPVIDIGCGTGLVGLALRMNGWNSEIDGVDISHGMLKMARAKGVYRKLFKADLSSSEYTPESIYASLISAGTFTHGHLGPDVLLKVLSYARKNAHAVIGINAQHFEKLNFNQAFVKWEEDGIITKPDFEEIEIYQAPEKKLALISDFRII